MRKIGLLVALLFLSAAPAQAAAPPYIPLQGVLTTTDGTSLDGDVSIRFAIYDSQALGNLLWSETQSVNVDRGFFTVYLGQEQALDLALFRDNSTLWLGITVESDSEMDRIYLASTPFSGYAEYCGNIPQHSHDYSELTGAVPQSSLPQGVSVGPQSCTGTDKVTGIDQSGQLLCGVDVDTTYSGADFATSNQYCTAGNVAVALDANGVLLCAPDANTTYTGADFALSAQSCNAGDAVTGIDASGNLLCAVDADTLYTAGTGLSLTGTEFSLAAAYEDGSAYDGRFVNVSGDTMTGPLNLPAEGLTVGATQLVCVDGKVGIGTSAPSTTLHVGGDVTAEGYIWGNTIYFMRCNNITYNCTPRQCLDLCQANGMRMATYNELYAWASGGNNHCARVWMLHDAYPDNPCHGYPMYTNWPSGTCGRTGTGNCSPSTIPPSLTTISEAMISPSTRPVRVTSTLLSMDVTSPLTQPLTVTRP